MRQITSGDMYPGVPLVYSELFGFLFLATPKSVNLRYPFSSKTRFSGLRSRCMTPLECTYARLSTIHATMNSMIRQFITSLLLSEVLIVTQMIAQIPTPEIFHDQVQVLSVLEWLDCIDDEWIDHLIEKYLLIYDWSDTLFHYYSMVY